MEETIKAMIEQANDEKNFDLICLVRDLLDHFASTINCPSNWRYLGYKFAKEYPENSWVYENLELYNFAD